MAHWFLILMLAFAVSPTTFGQKKCIDSALSVNYYIPGSKFFLNKIVSTPDSGLLLLGTNTQSSLLSDAIIIKLTSGGKVQWSRLLKRKTAGRFFTIGAITHLEDGSLALGFTFNDPATKKIGIIKLDEFGNIIWEKVYDNNFGKSKGDRIFRITSINEGKNGDLILNTYEDDPVLDLYGPGLTLLSKDGNVRWSIEYNQYKIQINAMNSNIYQNGKIVLWGKVPDAPCNTSRDFLNSFTLDYNTGNIEKVIRYCIYANNENVDILPTMGIAGWNEGFVSTGLLNGETVVYLASHDSRNLTMSLRFDEDLNFKKAYRIIPHIQNPSYYSPSHDVNEVDGSLFVPVYDAGRGAPQRKPYHYFLYAKEDGKKISQFYIDEPGGNPQWGFIQFQKNGRINEIINRDGTITLNNLGTATSASSFCNPAVDSAYGYVQPYQFVQSNSNYQWEDIRQHVYSAVNSSEIVSSPADVLQQQDCKKVSYCDSLKISGATSFCLKENSAVQFTGIRNAECYRGIEWAADTSYATIQETANDSTIAIHLRKPGTFKLFASLDGCSMKDSVEVTVYESKNQIDISKSNELCPGKDITLFATKGFVSYMWNDGSTHDSMVINSPGKYLTTGTDGCGNTISGSIIVSLTDTAFAVPHYPSICMNDSLKIEIPGSIENLDWDPKESAGLHGNSFILYPQRSATYTLKASFAKNCFFEKQIHITVNDCPETIYFPNSFSPNGDGLNDYFKPVLGKYLLFYVLSVYNRYGQKIFSSSDPNAGWNGSFKSSPLDSGVFTWICEYQFPGKQKKIIKGNVYLLK